MRFYTFWRTNIKDMDNAILLEDEIPYKTKSNAFKRAYEILKDFDEGFGDVLLVRRISTKSTTCREWIFDDKA